jgi:hypothetical protein
LGFLASSDAPSILGPVPLVLGPVPEVPRSTLLVRFPADCSAARFFAVFAIRRPDFFFDFLGVFFLIILDRPSLLFRDRRLTYLLAGSSTASSLHGWLQSAV